MLLLLVVVGLVVVVAVVEAQQIPAQEVTLREGDGNEERVAFVTVLAHVRPACEPVSQDAFLPIQSVRDELLVQL